MLHCHPIPLFLSSCSRSRKWIDSTKTKRERTQTPRRWQPYLLHGREDKEDKEVVWRRPGEPSRSKLLHKFLLTARLTGRRSTISRDLGTEWWLNQIVISSRGVTFFLVLPKVSLQEKEEAEWEVENL